MDTLPFCSDDVFHSHICRRVLRGQGSWYCAVDRGLDGRHDGRLYYSFVRLRAHVSWRSRPEVSISIGEVRLRVLRRGRAGVPLRDVSTVDCNYISVQEN